MEKLPFQFLKQTQLSCTFPTLNSLLFGTPLRNGQPTSLAGGLATDSDPAARHALVHKYDCARPMDHHSTFDSTTMSYTNIAYLHADGEVTINFYNHEVDQRTFETYEPAPPPTGGPRPQPTARPPTPSTAPPPPGGPALRPGSGASPSCPPNASGSTRRDHGPVPNRQFVRDETMDAVNNLMKRVRQEETDRAAMELGKANRLAHREIDRMRCKIARVESDESSTTNSTTD